MGWASYLEDQLERLQESVRLIKPALEEGRQAQKRDRREAIKALKAAEAILAEAEAHLDLATYPELDLASENRRLKDDIRRLQGEVTVAESAARKAQKEAANYYAELVDAMREVSELKKKNKNLGKKIDKLISDDFGKAVDATLTPGMLKKHKPNR